MLNVKAAARACGRNKSPLTIGILVQIVVDPLHERFTETSKRISGFLLTDAVDKEDTKIGLLAGRSRTLLSLSAHYPELTVAVGKGDPGKRPTLRCWALRAARWLALKSAAALGDTGAGRTYTSLTRQGTTSTGPIACNTAASDEK